MVSIVNKNSNLFLDLYYSDPTSGTKVITWPYNGGYKNQIWTLRRMNYSKASGMYIEANPGDP